MCPKSRTRSNIKTPPMTSRLPSQSIAFSPGRMGACKLGTSRKRTNTTKTTPPTGHSIFLTITLYQLSVSRHNLRLIQNYHRQLRWLVSGFEHGKKRRSALYVCGENTSDNGPSSTTDRPYQRCDSQIEATMRQGKGITDDGVYMPEAPRPCTAHPTNSESMLGAREHKRLVAKKMAWKRSMVALRPQMPASEPKKGVAVVYARM